MRRAFALAVIFLFGCSNGSSTQFDRAITESHAQVDRMVHDAGIPGAAIAVTVGDRIVWLESFGTSVRTDTRFRVGSVTKVVTAAALMRLADAGKVRLDAPVSLYLAGFPNGQVTLRQLAGHLAGIRHYSGAEFINRTHYESATASLARFANDPLIAAPGEKYAYSSNGFNVIGAVIERVTGQRFDAALRDLVIQPLVMHTRRFRRRRTLHSGM